MERPHGRAIWFLRSFAILGSPFVHWLAVVSLQRALYKDEVGRRITEPDAGPLFEEPKSVEGTESRQAKSEVDDPHGLSPDRMHREVGVDLRNSSGPAGHCKLADAVCGVAHDWS